MSNNDFHGENDINHLWDITYTVLYQILAGDRDGHQPEDVARYIKARQSKLTNCMNPFGKANKDSRAKVESGSLTLDGGAKVQVPAEVRPIIWKISGALDLDEQDTFILWRSFLRNRGLVSADLPSDEEIIVHFSDYYYEEKLSVLRCIIPLLRSKSDPLAPFHTIAKQALGEIMPKPRVLAVDLAKQYLLKTTEPLPQNIKNDPRNIPKHVKRNVRQQFVLLEVLYWTVLEYSLFDGSLVQEIYTIAYRSNLGQAQLHANMLLDEESQQLLRDMATLWSMILVELLQTMQLLSRSPEDTTSDSTLLVSLPEYLARTHDIIRSNHAAQYGPIILAWTGVLYHLSKIDISKCPAYEEMFSQASEEYPEMLSYILQPNFNLFSNMEITLLTSPLFVPSAVLPMNSPVTKSNAVDFRFTYKTLVICLMHVIHVEFLPDVNPFVDLWITLFGTGDEFAAARISRHYWDYDWKALSCRRAVFDVARSRFPVRFRPLVRLLRSMCGTGNIKDSEESEEDRTLCASYVYHYFLDLPTFTQRIPLSARSGSNASYEASMKELQNGDVVYQNTHPVRFPGGSVLPRGSSSRILSVITSPNEDICVGWEHKHNGWKLLLAVLQNYVKRTRADNFTQHESPEHRRDAALTLQDVGVEEVLSDETIVDALGLIQCVIDRNPDLATVLLEGLDSDPSSTSSDPDLVEATVLILEDALQRATPPSALISSVIGVLTALLSLPLYAYRVWPFFRSNRSLFGTDTFTPVTPKLLAAERVTGTYTMTLSIIELIRALFVQSTLSLLNVDPIMQALKETVLLRAIKFVHKELWMEHAAWKYVSIADRFKISTEISSLYKDILRNCPPAVSPSSQDEQNPFTPVTSFIMDAFVFRANAASINPIVNTINTGEELMNIFATANRHLDSLRLLHMLESQLQFVRLLLEHKRESSQDGKLSLLEQALCVGVIGATASTDSRRSTAPIDVITRYVQYRFYMSTIPLDAVRLLSTLCRSLSRSQVAPPSIVAHLSDAEGTAASFIQILNHPWDDLQLRVAIWKFVSLMVDVQPALSSLFVRGKFHIPTRDENMFGSTERPKLEIKKQVDSLEKSGAVKVACEALGLWDSLWDANPLLLATILEFLETVWRHALEHKVALESTRTDAVFWDAVTGIARRDLGPGPEWSTTSFLDVDGHVHSDCHVPVQAYAYCTKSKAHALQIIALDIEFALSSSKQADFSSGKLLSYKTIQPYFASVEGLTDYMGEAMATYYSQECQETFVKDVLEVNPSLKGSQNVGVVEEREYGDNYVFSVGLATQRTRYSSREESNAILQKLTNVNLNLSLADSGVALTRSWKRLLQVSYPLLRTDASVREHALNVAGAIAGDIARESRIGAPMITIHAERLSLLLALAEVTWFIPPAAANKKKHTAEFVTLVSHVRELATSAYFPPAAAIRLDRTTRFHRSLIQLIYFCARKARIIGSEPKAYSSEQRLILGSFLADSIRFVIEGLRDTFDFAKTSHDIEIDKDMELLVATFEQCTRPSLPLPPSLWLTKCHEVDLIRVSMDLLVRTDFTGLRDTSSSSLPTSRHTLYVRHILFLHLALARLPSSAESLANGGIVPAYANVNIRQALAAGTVEPAVSGLPGERNPSHSSWCMMLAILSNVTNAVNSSSQFLTEEIVGLIHLYGSQMTHALTWHVGEPLTLPFLEELGHVVALFNAVANSRDTKDDVTQTTLRTYAGKVSELLQDLNYALSHPNHLATLLEAVTSDERSEIEKDTKNLSIESFTELLNGSKRPLLSAVMQKTLFITRDIMSSLVTISAAETILTCDVSEWPSDDPLLTPITKVAPGATASIGTLLELGTYAVDVLKHLSNAPLTDEKKPTTPSSNAPILLFSPKMTMSAALQLLETTLVYGITQMAVCVSGSAEQQHQQHHEGARHVEMDEATSHGHSHSHNHHHHERMDVVMAEKKQRRRPSAGVTNLARIEEFIVDLRALLVKARPAMDKAAEQLKLNRYNLVGVLGNFVEKKIRTADGGR